ncbi:helix-turn-helix domain-containing protein [Emticicia sp. SJ17W-69]|uniref:helix-turn-helix domain-containing protein n=1 Tax=Emticicia sp. SJ17W-69 TaxID=3421657 RepID=UPI003EC00DBA
MSLISNNLKYLRRINGLTQDQFARRIGTKRANVGAYEESRAVPPVDTLKIIANTFGITVDDFVKKDIRKLRETPDLTFGFESKPFYSQDEPSIEKAPLNEVFKNDEDPFDMPPSIGDLMKQFLGNDPSNQPQNEVIKPVERVSQSVTLKPNFEREPYVAPKVTPPIVEIPFTQNQADNLNIQLVKRFQFNDYLVRYSDLSFLKSLVSFCLPNLPAGDYRAFEAGEDFAFEGALLIGSLITNWAEIKDGKNYVLVTKSQGIIYRRVYNQVKIKGTLLLSTDNNRFPSSEISYTDVIETWEIKSFVSQTLPEPSTPYSKLGNLVDEMKFELERIKK